METEEFFIVFACLMFFFDLILLVKAKSGEKRRLEYGFYVITLACALIAVAYFMLVQAFLNNDFSLKEVYSYSSAGLSLASKFYATWGGASSSMLFLAFLVAIPYFVYRFRSYEKRSAFHLSAYRILDFVLIFFLIIVLMNSPFERLGVTPLDGRGLNPLLQTFWMLVHPPIVFFGYVMIIFAFVFTLASMNATESEDHRGHKRLLQAAWLFSTLGIAIGGVWAYEVLGWGGYWAWDPVETGSLLPWLALTAYFHLGPISRAQKSLTKEFMLLLAFVSVVLTTALTRGGLLVSVHAFGASPIGPVFLLFALAMTIYFFYLKRKVQMPLFSLSVEKSSLYSLSTFFGFWSLVFIFLICLWGVVFPIIGGLFTSTPMNIGADFYNNWNFPFAMVFVATLIGCSTYEKMSLRKFPIVVAGALVAGAILVQVKLPTPNALANMGIPLLVVALLAVSYRLVQVLPKKRRSLRLLGRSILHFAIIITLIGIFISSTTKQASGEILTQPNTTFETLGLKIELGNFTVVLGTGNAYSLVPAGSLPEYSALKMDLTIHEGGNIYQTAVWVRYYTMYGIVSEPLIINTLTGDLYIRILQTQSMSNSLGAAAANIVVQPVDLIITVDKNPLIQFVWGGVALMAFGIAMPLIKELVRRPEAGKDQPKAVSKAANSKISVLSQERGT